MTYQETMAELLQSVSVDIDYALKQVTLAHTNCTKATIVWDCTQRALDALLRIQENLQCGPALPADGDGQ